LDFVVMQILAKSAIKRRHLVSSSDANRR
jgi:hypothetical protein